MNWAVLVHLLSCQINRKWLSIYSATFSETLLQSDIIGLPFGIFFGIDHSLGGLWILGSIYNWRGIGSSGVQRY